jgi:hypothetical protein
MVSFSFRHLSLLLVTLVCSIAAASNAAPSNDNIANATVLTGNSATDSVDNSSATQEPGDFAYRTLWWTWTATANGRVLVDTVNSAASNLSMKVWFRESNGTLAGQVAAATGGSSTDPKVSFPVSAGTTYVIGVGCQFSSSSYQGIVQMALILDTADPVGQLTFAHTATMANDSFAQRINLTGSTANVLAYDYSATNEAGEPTGAGYRTFWWKYRPATSGRITISGERSTAVNQTLGVFLGDSLATLRQVATDTGGSTTPPSVSFLATAGVDYQISMGCQFSSTSYSGAVVMTVTLDPSATQTMTIPFPATMANDNFANRVTLSGDTPTAIGYSYSATVEPSEPAAAGYHSFWWTYRPTANGRLTISGQGSTASNQTAGVFFGSTLADLKIVAAQSQSSSNPINLTIPVTAGQDYQIAIGTYYSSLSYAGQVVMTLSMNANADVSLLNIPGPATNSNDNFDNRVVLSGSKVSAIGYNLGATVEALEPTGFQRSLWWQWTAAASGTATLDFTGSSFVYPQMDLGIGIGTVMTELSAVPGAITRVSNTNFTFTAVAGTTYQIAVGSSSTSYGGSIVMTITGAPTKPVFSTPPASQLVSLGTNVSLSGTADATGYQWLKNAIPIAGATTNTYSISNAALTNAGAYSLRATNSVGPTTSEVANIGVVNTTGGAVTVNEAGSFSFTVSAAGPGLRYRWRLGATDLSDGKVGTHVITGAGTSKLAVSGVTGADAGNYTCVVSMDDPQTPGTPLTLPSGIFAVTVRLKPVVNSAGPFAWQVATTVTDQITAQNSPTKFTISNLPSGVTYNSLTGQLLGKPTAAVLLTTPSKKFSVVASNLAGNSPTKYFDYSVLALSSTVLGSYAGPVSRDQDINSSLGGSVLVTISTSGAVTGTLKLAAASYPLSGSVSRPLSGNPTASLIIKRASPLPSLTMSFIVDATNNTLTNGDITDGVHHATFPAWRKKWGTVMTQPEKDDLNRYLGRYTFALKAPAGQPTLPQGAGYGSFTVAATTGALTTAGKLADNTSFTSSTFCGPNGEVLVYQALYSNKGSIVGSLDLTQGSAGFVPPYGDNTLTGTVNWLRPVISGRVYPGGFGPANLTTVGGRYVAPSPSTAIVMGIVDDLNSNNATLTFSGADILSSPNIAFRLAAKSVFVKPVAASNPSGTTLTVTPSSGYVTGGFKLTDANAFVTTAVRSATYYGQIVRDSDNVMRGYGFFLLADSPAALGQTVSTTLQKSGLVVLQKSP